MTETVVHGARKIDADGIVDDFWLAFDGERIAATGAGDGWRTRGDVDVIDAGGAMLTPGFVDLHDHGAGGHSFDRGADDIRAGLAVHRAHGTTRAVVSLVSAPLASLRASLDVIAELAEQDPGVLGAHLEGPFLAADRRGAHGIDALRAPSVADAHGLLDAAHGCLRQVTIAPELPNALDVIDVFIAAGVVVAVGHTEVDQDGARRAFDHGATLLTHAFNAMPGIHHRHPGPVMAAIDDERVALELILDGLHVHPDVARMLFRLAGDRIALVTDAMAAAGVGDGHYRLGRLNVTVTDGRAVLSGTDTIAGSTLTLDRALRTAITLVGVDPVTAVQALTLTPARVLGRDDLGLLRPGYAADAVLLDADYTVAEVWCAGRRVTRETANA